MFTGLIESLGEVVEATPGTGSLRLGVASDLPSAAMRTGDSVAVDGVCLTVVQLDDDRFFADVIAETLSVTTLDRLTKGHRVNLERALRLGDRLGGHFVQGHVDATTEVLEVRRTGDDYRLRLGLPPAVRRLIAYKGSVALQGVSLTVSAAEPAAFEVALIPETLERTNLGFLEPGDRANVEVDLLARYVGRWLESGSDPAGSTDGRS